jgi:hypothetical protein
MQEKKEKSRKEKLAVQHLFGKKLSGFDDEQR